MAVTKQQLLNAVSKCGHLSSTQKSRIKAIVGGHQSSRFMTRQEAAEELDMSEDTISEYAAAGCFEAKRVGRSVRILRESFDNWLETLDTI